MILALLLMQAAAAPPDAPVSDEVVVIGERLKKWRASFRSRGGKLSCKVRESTGDAAIDAIGCGAMAACWPDAEPKFRASQAKGLAKDERRRLMGIAEKAFGECMFARRKAGIAELADRRAAERGL